MSEIKQYNYIQNYQRKLIYFNIFFSMTAASFLMMKLSSVYSQIFPYANVFEIVIAGGLIAHLIGKFCGRIIFRKIQSTRILFLVNEALFLAASAFAFFFYCQSGETNTEAVLGRFIFSPILYAAAALAVPFFLGIKNNYFLKASCGKFFDEKKGAAAYMGFFIFGLASVILIYHFIPLSASKIAAVSFLGLSVIPAIFISLKYQPEDIFAKDVFAGENPQSEPDKDEIFFNFLNFSSIAIYLFLGALAFMRYYGESTTSAFIFLCTSVLSILTGYALSSFARLRSWYIYSEILYPVFFFIFFILISRFGSEIPVSKSLFFFVPLGLLFGFTLCHSLKSILKSSDQSRAHHIIGTSFFALPACIFSAIMFILFTTFSYFLLFYIVAAFNIVLPGIYIAQKKMPEYKKVLFFLILIILIPSFIFVHKKFAMPFGSELILKHSNADLFRPEAPGESVVSSNGKIVIKTSGYARTSMERAVLAAHIISSGEKTLILSGSSQFFGIKSFSYFREGRIFSYVPGRFVDFNRPPVSGLSGPAVKTGDLLFKLATEKDRFDLILDIPNLFDITESRFRFSLPVISLIKTKINANGIYAVLIPSTKEYARERCSIYGILGKLFSNHSVFVSQDSVLIMASDSKDSLFFGNKSLQKLSAAIDAEKLFYEDVHFLSKMMSVNLKDQNIVPDESSERGDMFTDSLYSFYFSNNASYNAMISEAELQQYLSQKLIKHNDILLPLKEAEKYESAFEFDKEMQLLFSLKKFQLGYEIFSVYLENTLAAKEKIYIKEAELFEKEKKWEDARNLYKAVLVLNERNFDANCKLGLIAITVQDIDSAFIYFSKALDINPTNNLVNYQMGILLMSRGEYQKALEYLLKAIELNNQETKTIFFTGFCYENIGDLLKAEMYYKQAFLLDPQDTDIKTAVDRIAKKIEAERNKWKEEVRDNQLESEKDVNFPLPINESALKQRLSEKE